MNATMPCGCASRSPFALLALFVAGLLILAALAIASVAALVFFASRGPAPGAVAIPVLLTIAIVLLGLVLLLLFLLLWCCCRGKRDLADLSRLLKLLPMLRQAGGALESAAAGLAGLAQALRTAQGPVNLAGEAIGDAGEKVDISIPTVSARTRNLYNFGDVVVGLEAGSISPLHDAGQKLLAVGEQLSGPQGLSVTLASGADRCDEAAAGLRLLKSALDGF